MNYSCMGVVLPRAAWRVCINKVPLYVYTSPIYPNTHSRDTHSIPTFASQLFSVCSDHVPDRVGTDSGPSDCPSRPRGLLQLYHGEVYTTSSISLHPSY